MKKAALAIVFMILGIMGAYSQTITVESDRALETDFDQYKSFGWASQVSNELDEGVYFLNDLILKSEIRDAVKNELMGLGYEMKQDNPDLVVNFRVFEEPVEIRGFEGYQTGYWGTERYREISDTTTYNLEAGTLMVSLVDQSSGQIVWHGFASGLIKENEFLKDPVAIREAVNMIFEEYDVRASDYSRR